MLADDVDFVVGVDTHADQHALTVVHAATLRTCRQLTVAASRQGYRVGVTARETACAGPAGVGARR